VLVAILVSRGGSRPEAAGPGRGPAVTTGGGEGLRPAPETPPTTVAAAPARTELARGEVRRSGKDGLEYAWIPAGTFQMGCVPGDGDCESDESPRHGVTLSRGFWLGRTAVTAGAYKRYVSAAGKAMPEAPSFNAGWSKGDHPVVMVTWEEAKGFCDWGGGRLPTEAEWEYGARGGKEGMKYPWGNGITHEQANYGADECCSGLASGRDQWVETSPVGSFPANGYGLYDMAGNVWQWCADWKGGYGSGAQTNPTGSSSGTGRVLRGGSWSSIRGTFVPRIGLSTSLATGSTAAASVVPGTGPLDP